ncbi:NUDIX domain-containing protein [Paenibacillus sp. N1-5-1-14]|uniref:NUDIX domain-containing protein n=1 Tax=Paenibacillus radicibacter TaxID=2972488 RepID=UPI002158FFC1|nr:NUDIX domain-containing protein [Paenibacillus radicibacter]MCR8644388.1 NUDIX domain-containing protein [Paenibacillus radicibacter]
MKAATKVTAYITREVAGKKQLLIFKEQGFEHLGFQVPGGTVMDGEELEAAIVREVQEEAGTTPYEISYLGVHHYYADSLQTQITRHYYQMQADCLDEFTHVVTSSDEDDGWVYCYQWVDMDELPLLFGELGVYVGGII